MSSVNCKIILNLKFNGRHRHYTLDWAPVCESDKFVPPEDGTLLFTAQKVLHTGNSQVFQGTLTWDDDVYPSDVVCKVVAEDISRLRAEAEMYQTTLKGVQGFLVPHFIDFFSGASPYTGKPFACLLLKYAGVPLRGRWTNIKMQIRSKVIDALIRLHRLGVYHNEFTPRHVVVDSTGHPRIIDFDHATLHECRVVKRDFHLYEYEPPEIELDCAEVYEASVAMDIWTPYYVSFMNLTVDMRDIKDISDLVKLVRKRKWHLPYSDQELAQKAWDFLKSYDDHYMSRIRPKNVEEPAPKEADDCNQVLAVATTEPTDETSV